MTTEHRADACPDCTAAIPVTCGDGAVLTRWRCPSCQADLWPSARHWPDGEIGARCWAWSGVSWMLVLSEDAFDAALWA